MEVVLQRPMAGQLSRYLSEADWVAAPTLFISEVTNVFWKYQRLTDLSLQDCERGLEQAVALPDDVIVNRGRSTFFNNPSHRSIRLRNYSLANCMLPR
ncbi:MAG: type II toxin-antitoxin system VapC family toxin [Candidatus Electrothrix sp. Rat3]|nr:type II toxin-antitoxin system VapC family toxin [Candidatus Electrothrix rattekaaiensis]